MLSVSLCGIVSLAHSLIRLFLICYSFKDKNLEIVVPAIQLTTRVYVVYHLRPLITHQLLLDWDQATTSVLTVIETRKPQHIYQIKLINSESSVKNRSRYFNLCPLFTLISSLCEKKRNQPDYRSSTFFSSTFFLYLWLSYQDIC